MIRIKVNGVTIEIDVDETEEESSEIPFGFSLASETQISEE